VSATWQGKNEEGHFYHTKAPTTSTTVV